jgi:hypothetical protein
MYEVYVRLREGKGREGGEGNPRDLIPASPRASELVYGAMEEAFPSTKER